MAIERHAADAHTVRALALWPRLDPAGLSRAKGDPRRIARLVARRTLLPMEAIVLLLERTAEEARS